MNQTLKLLDGLLKSLLIVLVVAMVANVTWQVATRFLMSDPSSYTEELARFLLIWVGLLGGCYAYRTNAHIGLDLLTRRLEGLSQKIATAAALTVVLLFSVLVLGWGGLQLVLLTFELNQTSASLGIPVGYVYTVLPASGVIISIYCIAQFLNPKLLEQE